MSPVPAGSAAPAPAGLLEEVVELSRRFGADPEFSRAGGGNSSAKADGVLWIKPSGRSLAALTPDSLIPLDMAPLLAMLQADAGAAGSEGVMRVAMGARLRTSDDRRPSVECLFHALIPDRFVLHTHPTWVNALCCSRDGEAVAGELFGDDALWVPYVDPGLPLAREIARRRHLHEDRTGAQPPPVTLLQSHGLIVSGDSAEAVSATSDRVVAAIRERARADVRSAAAGTPAAEARAIVAALAPALRGLLATGARLRVVAFDDSPVVAEAVGTPAGLHLVGAGPLTPDQIVYTGSRVLVLDRPPALAAGSVVGHAREALARHREAGPELPAIVVVPGVGVLAAGDTPRQAETARHVYVDALRVGLGALRFGGVRLMTEEERRFIEEWEAEDYRRGVDAGPGGMGRAAGLVAAVVGRGNARAGEVAARLRDDGAHVVETAPDDLFDAVIRPYGGFDILVVEGDLPAETHSLATEVAAIQGAARPSQAGAIVERLRPGESDAAAIAERLLAAAGAHR